MSSVCVCVVVVVVDAGYVVVVVVYVVRSFVRFYNKTHALKVRRTDD